MCATTSPHELPLTCSNPLFGTGGAGSRVAADCRGANDDMDAFVEAVRESESDNARNDIAVMPLRRSAMSSGRLPSAAGGSSRGTRRAYVLGEVILAGEPGLTVCDGDIGEQMFATLNGEAGRTIDGAVDGRLERRSRLCSLLGRNDDLAGTASGVGGSGRR